MPLLTLRRKTIGKRKVELCIREWFVVECILDTLHPHLIFVISFTLAGFFNPNIFYTQKLQKHPQITTNSPQKCKRCIVLRSILKILHKTEFFHTGTACGACNKYEVWALVVGRHCTGCSSPTGNGWVRVKVKHFTAAARRHSTASKGGQGSSTSSQPSISWPVLLFLLHNHNHMHQHPNS